MKRMTTKTRSVLIMMVAFFSLILVGVPSAAVADDGDGCVCTCGTPGYWKNHPDAWPVDEITIGGVPYSQDEAIVIMQTPVKGDKSITMFNALVAAKLNVISGCPAGCSILGTIADADLWMVAYAVESGVAASSAAWQGDNEHVGGECLYEILDIYNNIDVCNGD